MGKPDGYNPLRWDCAKSGCYNQILRPRIEEFAGCFDGRIGLSDIDGFVEVARHFLFIEWKARGGALARGQRIAFERLTSLSPHVTVIVVHGEPREPHVESIQVIRKGRIGNIEPCTTDELKARLFAWSERAKAGGG